MQIGYGTGFTVEHEDNGTASMVHLHLDAKRRKALIQTLVEDKGLSPDLKELRQFLTTMFPRDLPVQRYHDGGRWIEDSVPSNVDAMREACPHTDANGQDAHFLDCPDNGDDEVQQS